MTLIGKPDYYSAKIFILLFLSRSIFILSSMLYQSKVQICVFVMDSTLTAKLCEYILVHHKQELIEILRNPEETSSFSIIVNFLTLFEENIDLGNGVLAEPENYLTEFDNATLFAQKYLLEQLKNTTYNENYKIKSKVFIRITGLPVFGETLFPSNDDLGSFIKINGTLIKVGAPKLLEYQRDYICKKCKGISTVIAKYEKYYMITAPTKCGKCQSNNVIQKKDVNNEYFKDYQEVKVQEHFGKSKVGTVPHTIWVTLEDNLVDSCKPGDDVIITGIVMRRWKPLKADMRYDIDLVLKANNLEVCSEQKSIASNQEVKESFSNFWQHYRNQELLGRNHILKSFCPQIYGMYLAKLAMVVVLAGGVQKADESGCSARGMSHILLVGDAGTGKSCLLRYASKISGRSVFTTGIGSTTAGLTVSAVRESGDWNLEAGALVLADGGVCCIDDFNSIREHDRTSIHEAMEQQSISVAKAGIVTKLHTRCSIFATTNPKGKYDCSVPMSVNVAISSPLLSRFDIVLILLDSKNPIWDKLLCEFIFKGGKNSRPSQEAFPFSSRGETLVTDIWSTANLQSYFSIAKQINPIVSQEAGTVLRAYYQAQRMTDSRNAARTTVRLLESLIRLSQGHARLMFRNTVTILDAIVAISLVESSMQSAALMSGVNALHTMLPEDPYSEYKAQLKLILTNLNLKKILDEELKKMKHDETELFDSERREEGNVKADSRLKSNGGATDEEMSSSLIEKRTISLSDGKEESEKSMVVERSPDAESEGSFNASDTSLEDTLSNVGKKVRSLEESDVSRENKSHKRVKLSEGEGDSFDLSVPISPALKVFSEVKPKKKENPKKRNIFSYKEDEDWSDFDL